VSWIALVVAVLALAFALSDQPWIRAVARRFSSNYRLVQEEVTQLRERRRDGAALQEAADRLRQASRAVVLEDRDDVEDHLDAAQEHLVELADGMGEDSGGQIRALAGEIQAIAEGSESLNGEAGAIRELAERIEALIPPSEAGDRGSASGQESD
jgi:hypothetical protein